MNDLIEWTRRVAWVGLGASAVVHVAFLVGRPDPSSLLGPILTLGVLFLVAPAFIVLFRRSQQIQAREAKERKEAGSEKLEQKVLLACPRWMKSLAMGLGIYCGVRFFWPFLQDQGGPDVETLVGLGDGSYAMFGYALALCIITAVQQSSELPIARMCGQGHPLDPDSDRCEVCGAGLEEPSGES
jgi:hypothetical protein